MSHPNLAPPTYRSKHSTLAEVVGEFLQKHSSKVIIFGVIATLLLMAPYLLMSPGEDASIDPSGEVFELKDDITSRFEPEVHGALFVAEARDGDILKPESLLELFENSEQVRSADAAGILNPPGLPVQPYLLSLYDIDSNKASRGLLTIADAVNEMLRLDPNLDTTLEKASLAQVKAAFHQLLVNEQTKGLAEFLSVEAKSEQKIVNGQTINWWVSPAVTFNLLADNEKLGGGTLNISLSGDDATTNKEHFARKVQTLLRGEERKVRIWGVAIDVGLESEDEGSIAGTFVAFTVIGAVVVVGFALRSYWATVLTGIGLSVLMVWLKGLSNLIQLKGGLVIELIVPIAMIALGVDFAVHALKRYQEEKQLGLVPNRALAAGFGGVMGALTLAMASDGIAFLSNTFTGIEAVTHYGIAAGIAVLSSFLVLGIFMPVLMMKIDNLRSNPRRKPTFTYKIRLVVSSFGVAALSGASVIFVVAPDAGPYGLGLAILASAIAGYIVIPMLIMYYRRDNQASGYQDIELKKRPETLDQSRLLVAFVLSIVKWRLVVFPAVIAVTVTAVFFALRLEPTFDVKDFFDSSSDFVVSLDKFDEHVAERSGEPGLVYVRGDLSDPEALVALDKFIDGLAANPLVAREMDGSPKVFENVVSIVRRMTTVPYARDAVSSFYGVKISDGNGDGLPDAREEIEAILDYAVSHGVPLNDSTLVFRPGQVRQLLDHQPGRSDDVAVFSVGIPGTRRQETVRAAGDSLRSGLPSLEEVPSITRAGLTGSPFTRQAQLEATTATLQRSIPIAAAGAFVLLLLAMRSFRYALVTIVPIGLVVAWLYALMFLGGFALNFVTATIGAVSIGVGIDYSIHMTERFREELGRSSSREQALKLAARGTGTALMVSGASSIVGFAILGFSPMPLFSSFGVITALMIFLALTASLLVLPVLLLSVAPSIKSR